MTRSLGARAKGSRRSGRRSRIPEDKIVVALTRSRWLRFRGWQAGEWRREFATRGRVLAQADCLVAAAARAIGGRLATGNPRDFPMAEVAVEHWAAGA
jgi:predicted nucleic acid-binding protein